MGKIWLLTISAVLAMGCATTGVAFENNPSMPTVHESSTTVMTQASQHNSTEHNIYADVALGPSGTATVPSSSMAAQARFEDAQINVHTRGKGMAASGSNVAITGGVAPGPGLGYVQKQRFDTGGYGVGSHNSDNSDPLGGGSSGAMGPSARDPKAAPILTGKSASQTAAEYVSERLNPVNAVRERAIDNNPAGEFTGAIIPGKVRAGNSSGSTSNCYVSDRLNPITEVAKRAIDNNPAGEFSGAITPAKARSGGNSISVPSAACPAGVCPTKSPLGSPLDKVGNPIPF